LLYHETYSSIVNYNELIRPTGHDGICVEMKEITGHRLWWSFGEPQIDAGELVANFYYQTGKHEELHLPWPVRRFSAAGELPIRVANGERKNGWITDLASGTVETGRCLYDYLGKNAQTSLIRTFANLKEDMSIRILCLRFPPPSAENRELCLALEDLPWELLHDGEDFIAQRYSLQIVRSHSRENFPTVSRMIDVSSWGILLVSPFVFIDPDQGKKVGLEPLPQGIEEIRSLRLLEKQTHGLVRVGPAPQTGFTGGIRTFADLEKTLLSVRGEAFHFIHFVGHGVIYGDEPCLCFEGGGGGIDYISVEKMRRLFISLRDNRESRSMPSVLFLNACSSSSRGRYSAGFASGLHDLGMCVLGYKAEVRDDVMPLKAAHSFYQSLCLNQPLQNPHLCPNVVTAIGAARRHLRGDEKESTPVWGRFRAYIPTEISFNVLGRGRIERTVQNLYAHFAQWMNPADYSDHLSIGFLFAIFFGALMGLENLAFILPETVLSRHLTYQEIVSELTRIFLVGPLSFLAAAIFAAFQTRRNHRFMLPYTGKVPAFQVIRHCMCGLPLLLAAGTAFALLFSYSFSRLDLLTAQTKSMSSLSRLPVSYFWYGLVGALGSTVAISLCIASWIGLRYRETLHSYRTVYFLFFVYALMIAVFPICFARGNGIQHVIGWFVFSLINIFAYSLAAIKVLKETSWRASQKSMGYAPLSWKKLFPLLGGVLLIVFCYFLLEESVRFEEQTIHAALIARREAETIEEKDRRTERIIERALRQRAVQEIPEGIRQAAEEDWLLCIVWADYVLFQFQTSHDDAREHRRVLMDECQNYLAKSIQLNDEVQYKDYFCNIFAMAKVLSGDLALDSEKKRIAYQEALEKASIAVAKDDMNFAYLDTLARAEAKLADLMHDDTMRRQAAAHIQEAEWRAFFLRSPRAKEIRRSIADMAERIQRGLDNGR
jgi:hypothetical protein